MLRDRAGGDDRRPPGSLVYRKTPDNPDGEPMPVLSCPELDLLALRAEEVAGALSLLYNQPVSCGPVLGVPETTNELVAESDADAALIAGLDGVLVDPVMRGTFMDSALGSFTLDGDLLSRVAVRDGVRVCWEARHAGSATAEFRDLWRTLELVFSAQDDALVKKVASSDEARELGFDEDELKDHLVLRGRASHGASRTGHREAAHVHHLVLERIGRLRALVERVLVGDLIPYPEGSHVEDFNRSLSETPVRRQARSS